MFLTVICFGNENYINNEGIFNLPNLSTYKIIFIFIGNVQL